MLVLGWLAIGLAFLFLESGILSLAVANINGSGYYVSPFGALRADLLGKNPLTNPSQWPWAQETVGGILSGAIEEGERNVGVNLLSGLGGIF